MNFFVVWGRYNTVLVPYVVDKIEAYVVVSLQYFKNKVNNNDQKKEINISILRCKKLNLQFKK